MTANLGQHAVLEALFRLIGGLKRQGLASVAVRSELPELLGIADRIMVIREGRQIAESDWSEATEETVTRAAVPGVLEHA